MQIGLQAARRVLDEHLDHGHHRGDGVTQLVQDRRQHLPHHRELKQPVSFGAQLHEARDVPEEHRISGLAAVLRGRSDRGDGVAEAVHFAARAGPLELSATTAGERARDAEQLAQGTIQYYESNMHLLNFRPEEVTTQPAFVIKNFPHLLSPSSPLISFYNSYYENQRAAILASNLSDRSWRDLVNLLNDPVILNNETIIRHVLDNVSALVLQKFAAEKLRDFYIANQFTEFDQVVLYMVRLMKKNNIYDDSKWIIPILKLYNPKQVGESDASIALRRGQVVGLWNLQKIFMFDIHGGMLNGALRYGNPENNINYALSFQEYGRSNPMLLDIGFLRNYGNVTGFNGVVAINWLPVQNAQHFTINVFHEGAHATEAAFKAKTPWKTLHSYYFEKSCFTILIRHMIIVSSCCLPKTKKRMHDFRVLFDLIKL